MPGVALKSTDLFCLYSRRYISELLNNHWLTRNPSSFSTILDFWEEEVFEIEEKLKEKYDKFEHKSLKESKKHTCKYCNTVFEKATSLGGHISKVHS